jgi:hypothetical protein
MVTAVLFDFNREDRKLSHATSSLAQSNHPITGNAWCGVTKRGGRLMGS